MINIRIRSLLIATLSLCGFSVHADIVWSGDMNLQLNYGSSPSYEFDFNDDGITDLLLDYTRGIEVTPVNGCALVNHGEILAQEDFFGDYYLGAVIDSSLAWGTDTESLAYYSYSDAYGDHYSGPWILARKGTLGVSFDVDGETHYGWLRMSNQYGTSVLVHDFAYESTPSLGIVAGAVPEPSSAILFTIGTIGAWALRKRNNR